MRVTDFMPERGEAPDVVRIVEGLSGRVDMRSELRLRFGYGDVVPWVRHLDGMLAAVAGPDAVWLASDVPHHGRDFASYADFVVEAGDTVNFVLTWHPSHQHRPTSVDPQVALDETRRFWADWAHGCTYDGPYRDAVVRSLVTLKALTYEPTGGIVAAATTSLPEEIGGERNWDYRYCWLRDASFTLQALVKTGFRGGGAGVARVAAARHRRQSGTAADPLRRRRRAPGARSRSSRGWPATRDRDRCGSATARSTSSSSTSTAR